MNKTSQADSARDYVEDVSRILCDLPTPSINGAVMQGAGVRFSSHYEAVPGPQRIILDAPTHGQPLATGMTAAAILARQCKSLEHLESQRSQLAADEERSIQEQRRQDPDPWNDHAAEVLDILRALPLLSRDFSAVFGELANLAGLALRRNAWEVRTSGGEWTGMPLSGLGNGFRHDALKAQTEKNATRLRRWRNALRDSEGESGSISEDEASSPALSLARAALTHPKGGRPTNDAGGHRPHSAALKHHTRALSSDEIAERRRRFPELFSGVAHTSASTANLAAILDRRRRFPELFSDHTRSDNGLAGEDHFEVS